MAGKFVLVLFWNQRAANGFRFPLLISILAQVSHRTAQTICHTGSIWTGTLPVSTPESHPVCMQRKLKFPWNHVWTLLWVKSQWYTIEANTATDSIKPLHLLPINASSVTTIMDTAHKHDTSGVFISHVHSTRDECISHLFSQSLAFRNHFAIFQHRRQFI